MNKNVGLTYVKDFSFPAEQGFTGSAGVHQVKGYQRGGSVKKAKGGPVKKQLGGLIGGPGGQQNQGREITVDDVTINVPMSHGGKMKGGKMSMHDKLKHEGGKMGYAYGGRVKVSDTSGEFKEKRGKQKTMDTGTQPARRGRNQAEIEAGGTKRMLPGLKKGGKVAKNGTLKALKKLKGVKSDADAAAARRIASGTGMPSCVKAHGGGVHRVRARKGGLAKYAAGGVVKKAGAAL